MRRCLRLFQSAPPVKGATETTTMSAVSASFQSAPPVKGATVIGLSVGNPRKVSIRAPREGGDAEVLPDRDAIRCFNPRPP